MTTEPFKAPSFYDSVGRRRKLSAGSMKAICDEYTEGKTIRELAQSYGVSTSLVRTVVYHTPRKRDLSKIEQE
ncbi:helix-turn-helix DNA binding domain protein [Arthrobacter phage Wyborn]|uniref:Helix-turn-helix DNA binding domain protein n=1 Tax=Arthrobacter phage Wyborn TaxID=3059067 RepID=A0AA96K818_9CAUD|nr:helix-turn-helix DNA binding domain protein [Arthrobacter phage Wyborn]